MITSKLPIAVACLAVSLALAGCNRNSDTATEAASGSADAANGGLETIADAASSLSDSAGSTLVDPALTAELPADTLGDDASLDALIDESEIPYPVYPNGAKYRVGGENGLKIVLFETTDSFEEVDAYYDELADGSGMPRLAAATMDDYVRYAQTGTDNDPWATDKPGIVIHRFSDDEARNAVGANAGARTNIIMSF